MSYTKITKPTGTSYTNTNSIGKQQYDQSTITYNDASTFYDGINMNAYTNIPKPSPYKIITVGMTVGLLIPLTNSREIVVGSPYTKINKPI